MAAQFEDAIMATLKALPDGWWQRVDGLMCEGAVLKTHPQWFPYLRLWLLEKRGLIRSRTTGSWWPTLRMKSYQAVQ